MYGINKDLVMDHVHKQLVFYCRSQGERFQRKLASVIEYGSHIINSNHVFRYGYGLDRHGGKSQTVILRSKGRGGKGVFA